MDRSAGRFELACAVHSAWERAGLNCTNQELTTREAEAVAVTAAHLCKYTDADACIHARAALRMPYPASKYIVAAVLHAGG